MTPAAPRLSFIQRWPWAYMGIAAVALALILALVLWLMRGSHLELQGTVQNVRTFASDEAHSIAIIDFRVTNLADYPWVVRQVTVSVASANGQVLDGNTVAEIDARRIFQYYPQLGAKNDTLLPKEKFAAHETKVRMIAAQFDLPEAELQKRRRLAIQIQELDGAESEIVQR